MPHHTRYIAPADWDRDFHPMERCVEIWSRWGSNEEGGPHSVQEALRQGHRLGFIGSTDNQFAQPGNGPFGVNQGAACTGVFADGLTREAIWDALHARRCYATTGEKMLLSFTMDGMPMGDHPMNDHLMGAEVCGHSGPRSFMVVAAGTDRLASVEILRNNEVVYRAEPGTLTFADGFTDETPLEDVRLPRANETTQPFCFYYLRVRQVDGHTAWASPIWVE
ncbi:MAG TPA: hypothetical protein DGT21_19430 [Armatimonadetes bacterium]|nr:hypothetical protein [Armatimonadota bacterium]